MVLGPVSDALGLHPLLPAASPPPWLLQKSLVHVFVSPSARVRLSVQECAFMKDWSKNITEALQYGFITLSFQAFDPITRYNLCAAFFCWFIAFNFYGVIVTFKGEDIASTTSQIMQINHVLSICWPLSKSHHSAQALSISWLLLLTLLFNCAQWHTFSQVAW